MGVCASLAELPAADFEVLKAFPRDARSAHRTATTNLDKAWYQLRDAFEHAPHPLCLALAGDHVCPSCGTLYDFSDYYLAYVSPGLVKNVSTAFLHTSEAAVKRMLSGGGFELHCMLETVKQLRKSNQRTAARHVQRWLNDGWTKNGFSAFKDLRKAYKQAAARGNALEIFIA
jgi:hypothetical protein